ncbi:MAG: 2,3,4,5-tetrahydropyridine-2,6-dicarboxylate N-succinyltransferase [Acidimicrobiales bacterium]
MPSDLRTRIEEIWNQRETLVAGDMEVRHDVYSVLELLDRGEERVAYIDARGEVVVNEWLKRAILLSFQLRQNQTSVTGPFEFHDKLPLKRNFAAAGVRALPGASARFGSFLARGVILMPSYVNIGSYVDENTMVDTWATVGSCAQIGKNVHLSGGVGIGGVLEPPQARPVVIEDDAFIGSRAMVTEGARVGRGAVLGAGVILNPSIPVIDVATGEEIGRGEVPPWSVAVSGTRLKEYPGGSFGIAAVLIIKRLDEGERHSKTQLNEILRENGASL